MRVKNESFYRCLVCSIVFMYTLLSPFYARAEKSGAAEVIETFNARLLESMKRADELGYSGRFKLLEPVIKGSFALPFMASQSVGGYWKTLTEEDRARFLRTYTEWTISSYAGNFDEYSGQRFEVVSESEPVQGTVSVISKLIPPRKEEVTFQYRLRKMEGTWRIVDIQVSGVSQLALTRSQFVSVIKNKGFDELLSMLNGKIKGFAHKKQS